MGWRPGGAPLGYINRTLRGVSDIIPDPERADIITEMFYKAAEGWSGRKLKVWLDENNITTRNGNPVPLSSVLAMLVNPFYYGEFQYPEGPGNPWYKGAHTPLVSKELWDIVQQSRGINSGLWGSKQFAYRPLLHCGKCGAHFTAQDKTKTNKKGVSHCYVYYCCTRNIKHQCDEKYINEEEVKRQLLELIEATPKKVAITQKLRAKVERHYVATSAMIRHYELDLKLSHPLVEYARYIIKDGTAAETATFVEGITTKVFIKNGKLYLENNTRIKLPRENLDRLEQ